MYFHFIQGKQGIHSSLQDRFGKMSGKDRFYNILTSKELYGNKNKGYLYPKENTISFSGDMGDLEKLVERRTNTKDQAFGLIFKQDTFYPFERKKEFGKVLCLTKEEIKELEKERKIIAQNRWLIDLKEPGRYDFSWEDEYRLKVEEYLPIIKSDIQTAIVPETHALEIESRFKIQTITFEEIRKWKKQIENYYNEIDSYSLKLIKNEIYREKIEEDNFNEKEFILQTMEVDTTEILTESGEYIDDGIKDELLYEYGEHCIDQKLRYLELFEENLGHSRENKEYLIIKK